MASRATANKPDAATASKRLPPMELKMLTLRQALKFSWTGYGSPHETHCHIIGKHIPEPANVKVTEPYTL